MYPQIMDPQIMDPQIIEKEKPDCRRCKSYFKTEDCIILEMKKILPRG